MNVFLDIFHWYLIVAAVAFGALALAEWWSE